MDSELTFTEQEELGTQYRQEAKIKNHSVYILKNEDEKVVHLRRLHKMTIK